MSEPIEKIEQVKKLSKSVASFQRVVQEEGSSRLAADKQRFDTEMNKPDVVKNAHKIEADDPIKIRPTLMDEAASINKRMDYNAKMSAHDLVAQTEETIKKIDGLKATLNQPGVEIPGSAQHLLKDKLTSINESLKVAFQKAGLDYVPPTGINEANPVKRFLDMLAHGQSQLEGLSTHVNTLAEHKTELGAAEMLALQLKVNNIQQELEFFTALLSKTLESTKTLMNVQV